MQTPVFGLQPGSVIQDTYRIDALLGEGGMGATFRATNLATGHPVAIKVMAPAFAANRQAADLFRRESTHLRSVLHDAVIRYETTLMDREGRLFLVMEFVDGKPLKHYLGRGARLASADVLTLGLRLAQGLAAIHALGIVHRDIAPDNIMVPGDNVARAKLIDFGLASDTVGTDKSIIGSGFAGKYDFCAPEQFGLFGNRVGAATDRYALGLVLMRVAGLPIPGAGKGLAAVEDRRKDLVIPATGLSAPLRDILQRLLRADPASRPTDLVPLFEAALAQTARAAPGGKPASGPPLSGPPGAQGADHAAGGGKRGLLLALGGGLALAAGGAAWLFLAGSPGSDGQAADQTQAVATARETLAADDPLHAISAQITAGGAENLNAALGALIAYQRDPARPLAGRQQALMMLARMYDPATHDPAHSPFATPNAAAARRYYQQAAELGAAGAAEALAALPTPSSP